jgi:hypothetical protein
MTSATEQPSRNPGENLSVGNVLDALGKVREALTNDSFEVSRCASITEKTHSYDFTQSTTVGARNSQKGSTNKLPPPSPRKKRNFLRIPRDSQASANAGSIVTSSASTASKSSDVQRTKQNGNAHKLPPPSPRKLRNFLRSPRGLKALKMKAAALNSTVKEASIVKGEVPDASSPAKIACQNQKLETIKTEAAAPIDTVSVTEAERFDTRSTDSSSETKISSASHDGDVSIEVETSSFSAGSLPVNPKRATERSKRTVEEVLRMTDHIVEEENEDIAPLSSNLSSWAFAANFTNNVARLKGRKSGERFQQQKGSYNEPSSKQTGKEALVASKVAKTVSGSIIETSLKEATSDELSQLVNTLTEAQKHTNDDRPHRKGPPSVTPLIAAYKGENHIPVANSIDTRGGTSGCSRTTVPIANTQTKSGPTVKDIKNTPIAEVLEHRISRDSSGDAYSYDYTEVSGFGTEDEGFLSNDTGALSDPPRDEFMTFSAETLSEDEYQDDEEDDDDDDIHSIGDLSAAVVEETRAVAKEIRDGMRNLEVGLTKWTRCLSCNGPVAN